MKLVEHYICNVGRKIMKGLTFMSSVCDLFL